MNTIYEDDENVGLLTRLAFEATRSRLLQIHRFSIRDEQHAHRLLQIFDPPNDARIADVGCGVGRLAELMKSQRPDLDFVLTNKSPSQLGMCSSSFETRCETAEDMSLTKGYVDAIMVTYVLGHVDLEKFIQECQRIGVSYVYVFDLFKLAVSEFGHCRLKSDLGYTERTIPETIAAFADGGFNITRLETATKIPPEIENLMPSWDTLLSAVSAAMVFENE